MEAVAAIFGITMIVAIAGGVAAVTWFVALRPNLNISFPQQVPGWKTRADSIPTGSVEDIARINNLVLRFAPLAAGYTAEEVHKALNKVRIHFVEADPELGSMHVLDPYGRKDKNGNIIKVAGWADGYHVYIVWKKGVSLIGTAYAHELCHVLQALFENGFRDYDHVSVNLWGKMENGIRVVYGVVNLVKENF